MGRRALLTGGNGFLGRSIAARLIAEGWLVARLGRSAAPDTLVRPVWDAASFAEVLAATAPDVVFHLAGSAWASPVTAFYETNLMLAARLLDAVASRPVPPAVVLIGSAAEYGFVPTRAQPVSEDFPCAPTAHHGLSKLAQTRLGLAWTEAGLRVLIARPFNLVGAGMPPRLALPSFAAQIGAAADTLAVGNLDVARDFIDVAEAARLIVALAADPARYGPVSERPVVNICSGLATPLRPLVEGLIRLAGRPIRIVVDPGRLRPGEMRTLTGDTSRLRDAGLVPKAPDFARLLPTLLGG